MTRRLSHSPWRYTVLVRREPTASDAAWQVDSDDFATLRLVDIPVSALAPFLEAVKLLGGRGHQEESRPSARGPGRVCSAVVSARECFIQAALERTRCTHPDLAASIAHALDSTRDRWNGAWSCGKHSLAVKSRPLVMGIMNLTPDSFSDGGELADPGAAEARAIQMVEDGADILDLGGESTRPGARPPAVEEELRRVLPVFERLTASVSIPLSIDTSRGEVARAAIDRGASIINDVRALRADPDLIQIAAESDVGLVLMHMQGEPPTMQQQPQYRDLVGDIYTFLRERVRECQTAGIAPERIAIDPGIGFGKTADHNLALLRQLRDFSSMGLPVLVGASRKGFLGKILDLPVNQRLEGTIAACVAAAINGATVLRVHDVGAVVKALNVTAAIAAADSE